MFTFVFLAVLRKRPYGCIRVGFLCFDIVCIFLAVVDLVASNSATNRLNTYRLPNDLLPVISAFVSGVITARRRFLFRLNISLIFPLIASFLACVMSSDIFTSIHFDFSLAAVKITTQ